MLQYLEEKHRTEVNPLYWTQLVGLSGDITEFIFLRLEYGGIG